MSAAQVSALHSGAAMDRPAVLPRAHRWRRRASISGAALLALIAGLWAWQHMPRGLPVMRADVEIATAQQGLFHDVLVSRATVLPLQSVLLDAAEDGRVDQVLVKDGAEVQAGQLLYVLASAQHAQELMARSSEAAQQLANLATFRAAFMAAQATQRRELTQAGFELESARRTHTRNETLAAQGFISAAVLDESRDKLDQAKTLLQQLRDDGREELATREQSVRAMERAVLDLDRRLSALRAASDGLAVRAPVAGRLTGFALQIGESVRAASHVARIDSTGRFKLQTQVDEFYLPRIAPGLHGTLEADGHAHDLQVTRIDPQVKDGRFSVELEFTGDAPATLQVGQGLDARLTLGQPQQALLLKDGGFSSETGGTWAFVLDADERHAERRALRTGRHAAGQIEVLGGLHAGERVIVSSYRPFAEAASLQLND
ncbi:MAG TPA: HlyD family efflux transporter periplasmic adaptor subunit [Burkholderiaceae bacterium]|jgi:HlyD family secretion protein